MKGIDKATRFANYAIDFSVIVVVWVILVMIFNVHYFSSLLFYAIMFLYYFVFELTTHQTLGKMLTKTKVVLKNGSEANGLRILMRSVLRLIPFDGMSYLFGYELGFHDLLSSTKLVKTP